MSVSFRASQLRGCADSWATAELRPGALVAIDRDNRRLPARAGIIDSVMKSGSRWKVDVSLLEESVEAALQSHGAFFAGQHRQRVRLTDADFDRLHVLNRATAAAAVVAAPAASASASASADAPLPVGAFVVLRNKRAKVHTTTDSPAAVIARVEPRSPAQSADLLLLRWFRESAPSSCLFERTGTLFFEAASACTLRLHSMVPDVASAETCFWTCDCAQRDRLVARACGGDAAKPTACTCVKKRVGYYVTAQMLTESNEQAMRARGVLPTSIGASAPLCAFCAAGEVGNREASRARLLEIQAARTELSLLQKRWDAVTSETTNALRSLEDLLIELGGECVPE
tara:strand:+ start:102 stop:1130 length:1029 start_codon:yes stop_codon:yes gene_type:complete